MHVLRQIAQRHNPGAMSICRATDDQIVSSVGRMLESGLLRICANAPAHGAAEEVEHFGLSRFLCAVRDLQFAGDLQFRGRSFKIIPSGDWRRYREAGNYEIVPRSQAREIIGAMSTEPRRDDTDRSTLKSVLDRIADDSPVRPEEEVILLRTVQMRVSTSSNNSVITPAEFAKAKAPRQDFHWIEIEIVGDDGVGIPGQEYLIVAPDKRRFTGVTDKSGRARLESLVAGQCSISFVNLDKSAWGPA
jgi:hypothetical protein